jgi:hypothetical protein
MGVIHQRIAGFDLMAPRNANVRAGIGNGDFAGAEVKGHAFPLAFLIGVTLEGAEYTRQGHLPFAVSIAGCSATRLRHISSTNCAAVSPSRSASIAKRPSFGMTLPITDPSQC